MKHCAQTRRRGVESLTASVAGARVVTFKRGASVWQALALSRSSAETGLSRPQKEHILKAAVLLWFLSGRIYMPCLHSLVNHFLTLSLTKSQVCVTTKRERERVI